MAQKIFELSQLSELISKEIRDAKPEFDPSIPNNWVFGLTQGIALSFNNLNYKLLQAEDQAFWQTASGVNLDRHANDRGLSRFGDSASSGDISISGIPTTVIPAGTIYSSGGVTLETQDEEIIVANIIFGSSITFAGGVATFTSTAPHGLSTGVTVTITGWDQSEYNTTEEITYLSEDSFSYPVSGSPITPGSGSGQAQWDGINASVISQATGGDQNLASGAVVSINASIAGAEDDAYVSPAGLTGGRSIESDEELRERIENKAVNPSAGTAPSNIDRFIKENFEKVTWTLTKRATPTAGSFETYVIQGNEDDIIPNAAELQAIKDLMIEEIVGATTDESNVYILAPTEIPVNFILTSVVPNTSKMQVAITDNLKAFFLDNIYFETVLTEDAYRNAIQSTIDEDGNPIQSFTLLSPSGSIIPSTGEIASIGTVTFS